MPKYQPAHEKYWPSEPSPLRLYWYCAADVEEAARVEEAAADAVEGIDPALTASVSAPTSPEDQTHARDVDNDEGLEESPRKRRRITTASDDEDNGAVDLTIEYARRATVPPPPTRTGDTLAQLSPSTTDAGWSFRALEPGTSEQDETARNDLQPQANSNDGGTVRQTESADITDNPVAEDTEPDETSGSWTTGGPSAPPGEPRPSQSRISPDTPTPIPMSDTTPSLIREQSDDTDRRRIRLDITARRDPNNPGSPDHTATPEPPRPDSPDEVPAHAAFASEGTGRLGRLVRVGSWWS